MSTLRALVARFAALPWPLRAVPPCGWAAAIWLASAQPGGSGPQPWWWRAAHNGAHVAAYAALAVLVWLALAAPRSAARAALAVLLTAAYGVADELHQLHVPRRVASAGDAIADLAGAVLGVALIVAWQHRLPAARRWALLAIPVALLSVALESK